MEIKNKNIDLLSFCIIDKNNKIQNYLANFTQFRPLVEEIQTFEKIPVTGLSITWGQKFVKLRLTAHFDSLS